MVQIDTALRFRFTGEPSFMKRLDVAIEAAQNAGSAIRTNNRTDLNIQEKGFIADEYRHGRRSAFPAGNHTNDSAGVSARSYCRRRRQRRPKHFGFTMVCRSARRND